jgi:transglutaminase-like putative cysteine protease
LSTAPTARTTAHHDSLGNWVHRFNVLSEHRRLRVEADSVVLVHEPPALPDDGIALSDLGDLDDLYDFLAPTVYVPHAPEVQPIIEAVEQQSGGSAARFALLTTERIHRCYRYEKGATHVQSSIYDVLSTGAGVCQDFSHLLLAALRMRGLPSRYVSGYLVPRRTAEPGASVEEVIGGQASHAWVEVFLPGPGWVGLDPTMGRPSGLQHVRIAYGRDYGDVPPVRGVYKGHAGQRLSVDVRVRPALDSEGWEVLQESSAAPAQLPHEDEPQQQQQQQ